MLGIPRGSAQANEPLSARPLISLAAEDGAHRGGRAERGEATIPEPIATGPAEVEPSSRQGRAEGDLCGRAQGGGQPREDADVCVTSPTKDTAEAKRDEEGLEGPSVPDSAGSDNGVMSPGALSPGDGLGVFERGVGPSTCTDSGVGQKSAGRSRAFVELQALCTDGCGGYSNERFCGLLGEGLPHKRCVLQLGITMLQLLLCSPRDGSFLAGVSALVQTKATPNLRGRDVLPLPVPPVGAVLQLFRYLARSSTGLLMWDPQCLKHMGKQHMRKLVKASCFQLWRLLIVAVLNGEYQSWENNSFYDIEFPGNASQADAFNHLDELCNYFARNPLDERCGLSPQDVLKTKGVDYTGDEVLHALPLKVGELLPGLPADGVAGSLQASEIAEGDVAKWLLDPELTLLPRDKWPSPLPRASMNCTREDWCELVPLLVKKRILEPISKSEIFTVNGTPVLNGAFAVPKKGVPGIGQIRVTRLIMNMIPSNSLQRLMQGDLATVAGSSGWVGAHLRPNQVLLWSGEDQRGAYYAWSLPRAWRKFMAFKWPVPGELVGMPGVSEVFLAAAVIPMGWVNAVGLFQHLHRRLGLAPPPCGAGHREEQEWRRDRPVPSSAVSKDGVGFSFILMILTAPNLLTRKSGSVFKVQCQQRTVIKKKPINMWEWKSLRISPTYVNHALFVWVLRLMA